MKYSQLAHLTLLLHDASQHLIYICVFFRLHKSCDNTEAFRFVEIRTAGGQTATELAASCGKIAVRDYLISASKYEPLHKVLDADADNAWLGKHGAQVYVGNILSLRPRWLVAKEISVVIRYEACNVVVC